METEAVQSEKTQDEQQQDMNTGETFIERLEAIEDLPSLPEIVTRLNKAIEDAETSANDVAAIMQDDPAITAKVLRLVNSAYYGTVATNDEITSVPYAVARMGFNEVRNIVLTMSVFSAFKGAGKTIDRREFWRHCISVGITTKVIYNFASPDAELGEWSPDTFFVAGLLHDVGIIVLEQYFHGAFARVCEAAREKQIPLHRAEEDLWGVGHGDIGAYIANRWNMPMGVVEAANFHHEPQAADESFRKLVNVVHLADFVCNSQSIGDAAENMTDEFSPRALLELGIPTERIGEFIDVVIEESTKSETLLSLV